MFITALNVNGLEEEAPKQKEGHLGLERHHRVVLSLESLVWVEMVGVVVPTAQEEVADIMEELERITKALVEAAAILKMQEPQMWSTYKG